MRKKSKNATPVAKTPPAPAPPTTPATRSPALLYVLASVLLLVPCYWQPRLQLGDLSSHIYNAWLAQLIESGRAPGLVIVPQTTNVLFDLMLSGLFKALGAEAAQRISVSLAVLTFVWGAFAFVSVVAGRRAWGLMPVIAMLAYGWVLHMGLFDFYLSLGLCFWALALAWEWKPRRVAAAAPVLILAYVAHGLPVAWTVALLAYLWVARPMTPPKRAILMAASLAVMVAARAVVTGMMSYIWVPQQIMTITGTDQLWVFDDKYLVPFLGLLLVSVLLFVRLLGKSGARDVVSGLPFQIGVLSAAGVCIVPTRLQIPGYNHALVYIAERMSLAVGICLCALLAAAPMRAYHRYAMGVVALLFFGFLYRDESALNAFEDPDDAVGVAIAAGAAGGECDRRSHPPRQRVDSHDRPRLSGPVLQLRQLRTFHRAVPDSSRGRESDRGLDLRGFVVLADRQLRGEGARPAALPGGPGPGRPHGHPYSGGRHTIRDHVLERAVNRRQRAPERDIVKTSPIASTSASPIRPPAADQPECPKDTRP